MVGSAWHRRAQGGGGTLDAKRVDAHRTEAADPKNSVMSAMGTEAGGPTLPRAPKQHLWVLLRIRPVW